MGWFVRKAENGLMFNDKKPVDQSYVELSFNTPDSVLYSMGFSFDELLEAAKKYEGKKQDTLIDSFYEHKMGDSNG